MAPLPEYAVYGTPPPHRWAGRRAAQVRPTVAELVPRAAGEALQVLTPVEPLPCVACPPKDDGTRRDPQSLARRPRDGRPRAGGAFLAPPPGAAVI